MDLNFRPRSLHSLPTGQRRESMPRHHGSTPRAPYRGSQNTERHCQEVQRVPAFVGDLDRRHIPFDLHNGPGRARKPAAGLGSKLDHVKRAQCAHDVSIFARSKEWRRSK